MSIFRCNKYKRNGFECGNRPYVEVFPLETDKNGNVIMMDDCNVPKFSDKGWSYLCRWHFYMARLRRDKILWCKVDSDRDTMENILEEIWDIQSDIYDIKEKLGIKDETPDYLKWMDEDE